MKYRSLYFAVGTLWATGAALASNDADIAMHRHRLVLSEAPPAAQQLLALRKQLAADRNRSDALKPREAAVFGQVGGMPNVWPDTHPQFPWYPGQTSFFMVDSQIARQFAQHAKQHGGPDNCVFCRQLAAKNVGAIAVINLVDERGKTLPIDLRQIVDLKEDQIVTVRGKAKLLAGSMLVIDADGIYVDPPTMAARKARGSTK